MCADCEIIRTPRSRHCAICNRCVERYDHHCPWINNCIGINNHRAFLFFTTSLTVLIIIVILSCGLQLVDPCSKEINNCPLSEFCIGNFCENKIVQYIIIGIQLIFLIIFGLPLSATLAFFHMRNFSLGKTTNERFSRRAKRSQSSASVSEMTSMSSQVDRESLISREAEAYPLYRRQKS